jgi:hypothetical protein
MMRPPLDLESIDVPALAEEFSRVVDAQNQSNHLKHRIFDLSATPDEVLQWYFTRDPYIDNDALVFEALKRHKEEDSEPSKILINDMVNEPTYVLIGGTLLAASIIIPKAFDSEDPIERKKIFAQYFSDCRRFNEITCPPNLTSAQALLLTCASTLNAIYEFQESDAENIFIAAEMLANGAGGREGFGKLTSTTELDAQFNEIAKKLSRKLYEQVASFGTEASGRRELSDGVRMLGMTASLNIAERTMGASMNTLTSEGLVNADSDFAYLVTRLLNTIFYDETGLDQRLRTPPVKGPLHEIIWFIDAYVLRRMHPEKYGNIRMNPSYLRDDAPEIGYPRFNRGYDFVVSNGVAQDYVQNKSGSSKTEYHPAITVLEEINFLDIANGGKRLRSKLTAYQKWITEDCNPEMIPILEKYILPTARTEMDDMTTLTETRRKVISEELMKIMKIRVVDFEAKDSNVRERNKKILRDALSRKR